MAEFKLPPIPDESRELLDRLVPPPNQPPLLYLAMSANPAVLRAYEGPILSQHGLLHTEQLDPADRELAILRITARCGAEHEWGVHVAYFGKTSGLTTTQVEETVTNRTPNSAWTPRQEAIITICDAIVDQRPFTPDEKSLLDRELDDAQRAEFVATAALYLGISATCNTLAIPPEPGAPTFPSAPN